MHSNSIIGKGLIGLGGLSAVVGGGILAWQQGLFSRKPETIREKLKKEGYTTLSKTSSHWAQIFDVYKKNENTKKFEDDGITSSSTNEDHDKLKRKCEIALNSKSYKEEDYSKVIKWCVVPRKVEDLISNLLGVDTSNTNDNGNWKPILTDYISTKHSTDNTYALSSVVLTSPSSTGNENENINKLKEGCKARRGKLTYELDFETSMTEVKKWCVNR